MKYSTLGGALLKEDAHHIIVRLPVMNLKRQIVLLRQANMLAKAALLSFNTFLPGAEVVETGLADSAHARFGGKRIQGLQSLIEGTGGFQFGGGVGVNSNRRQNPPVGAGGGNRIQRGRNIAADLHNGTYAEFFSGIEGIPGSNFYFAIKQVHMGVVIDDGVRQRLGRWREHEVAGPSVVALRGAASGAFARRFLCYASPGLVPVKLGSVGRGSLPFFDLPAMRKHARRQFFFARHLIVCQGCKRV